MDEELLCSLRKHGRISGITNIVFVDTSYKSKVMDVDETFIAMGTGNIASIGEIPLLAGRVVESSNSNRYFYLYYDTITTGAIERKKEAAELRNAVKSFFGELFSKDILS